MENWNSKKQVKKGDFAEDIVHKYLESKGFVVYKPTTESAHSFDRLAIKDKQKMIIAEIKAKAKLNNYNMTGFDYRHYLEYKSINKAYNIPIFIFFIDEMLKEIYGNFLSVLEKNKIIKDWKQKMILFDMDDMIRNIYNLSEEEVEILKKYSTRRYEYKKL